MKKHSAQLSRALPRAIELGCPLPAWTHTPVLVGGIDQTMLHDPDSTTCALVPWLLEQGMSPQPLLDVSRSTSRLYQCPDCPSVAALDQHSGSVAVLSSLFDALDDVEGQVSGWEATDRASADFWVKNWSLAASLTAGRLDWHTHRNSLGDPGWAWYERQVERHSTWSGALLAGTDTRLLLSRDRSDDIDVYIDTRLSLVIGDGRNRVTRWLSDDTTRRYHPDTLAYLDDPACAALEAQQFGDVTTWVYADPAPAPVCDDVLHDAQHDPDIPGGASIFASRLITYRPHQVSATFSLDVGDRSQARRDHIADLRAHAHTSGDTNRLMRRRVTYRVPATWAGLASPHIHRA